MSDREGQLSQLQADLGRAKQEVSTAKTQLDMVSSQGQARDEKLATERKEMLWKIGSLEQELKAAKESQARLQDELASKRVAENDLQDAKAQWSRQLAEQESKLKQAESVIRLLQTTPPPQPSAPPVRPLASSSDSGPVRVVSSAPDTEPSPRADQPALGGEEAASPPSDDESTDSGSSKNSEVKVYQVNDEFNFVVLSIKGIEWAQKGMTIVLANDDNPVATAQLTELDGAGFAVAQITHKVDPVKQIRKGDVLMARPLLRPGAE